MKTKTKKPTGFDRDEDTAAIVSCYSAFHDGRTFPPVAVFRRLWHEQTGGYPSRALIRRCLRMAKEL